jgi:hypothetical protein
MTEPFDEQDAELEPIDRALRVLGGMSPEPGRADAAVAAAIAGLRTPAPAVSTSRPKRIRFRRWLMPASFAAAAAAIAFAFWVSFTPSSTASAAEVLQEAIAKRAQFTGTVDVEQWDPKNNRWIALERSVPAAGQSVRWGDPRDDSESPDRKAPMGWRFLDLKQKVQAEYRTDLKTVYVADLFGEPEVPPTPFDEQMLLKEVRGEEWSSARSERDGQIELVFTQRPKPPAAHDSPATQPSNMPHRFRVALEKSTGQIRTVDFAMTPDAPAFTPYYRYNYAPAAKALSLEALPVPEGTARVDNRMAPEVKQWLATRDALHEQGIGFETAALVRYSEDPFGGGGRGTRAAGTVSIYAGKPDRWMNATWSVGADAKLHRDERQNPPLALPRGWPKPTFADVMSVVRNQRPQQFMAYDGKTVWRIEQNGKTRTTENPTYDGPDLWRRTNIVSLIWPHSDTLLGGSQSLFTQVKVDKVRQDKVVSFTRFYRNNEQPYHLNRFETDRLDFNNPAPWAEFHQQLQFWEHPDLPEDIWQWNYDVTSMVMYRDPVRVPTFWRRVVLDMNQSPTYTEFTRLIPAPKQDVPAEWFGDPRKAWGGE